VEILLATLKMSICDSKNKSIIGAREEEDSHHGVARLKDL